MNALLDTILSLVIVGGAMAIALPQLVALSMQPAQDDAGNQVAQMQVASASYIKNHFATLLSGIPVGGNTAVTPAMLTADGDLPSSFNDFNVFGQKHILVIAQPSTGQLDGMVFTYGGDTIQDPVAIRVAQAGPPNAVVLLASNPANFEGAAGGQTVPIGEFAIAGYPIAAGHIGAHIEPATYAAVSPFLNRYFTGNPEDNTLHTDLLMNGQSVQNARTVVATQQVTTPILADPGGTDQVTPAGTSQIVNLNASGNVTVTGTVRASVYTY